VCVCVFVFVYIHIYDYLIIYFTIVEPQNNFREFLWPSVAGKSFPTRPLHYFVLLPVTFGSGAVIRRKRDRTARAGALSLRQISTANASKLFINTVLVT
jgi:hypothetical protein